MVGCMDSQRYLYLWQNEKPPEITLSVKFLRLRAGRGLPARAWPSSNFPGTLVWGSGALASLGRVLPVVFIGMLHLFPVDVKGSLSAG